MVDTGRVLSFIFSKLQGNRIDAVTLVGGLRAVVEHMTEVGAAGAAHHLSPFHDVTVVGLGINVFWRDGLPEAWPACAGIKFCI